MPPVSFPATTGLRFDWKYPEPPVIEYQLAKLEGYFLNPISLAEVLKAKAMNDMAERFEEEVDPDGIQWKELVEPAEDQVGILRLTEDMYHAAISEDTWDATPAGVFFDTSKLPGYWQYHEQPSGGEQRIPRRAFVGVSESYRASMIFTAEGWLDMVLDDVTDYGYQAPSFGASWGFSAAGEMTFGIPLGSRGFVPVGRVPSGFGALSGTFISLG